MAIVDTREVEAVRFPVIESIDAVPNPNTKGIGSYLMKAAGGYVFSELVLSAVNEALLARIPGLRLAFTLDKHNGKNVLGVSTFPWDSYEGSGRFVVYGVLRELFNPRAPHTAIMQPTVRRQSPLGFDADLWVIGHPTEQTLHELESRIRATPGVAYLARTASEDKPHQFALIADGAVEDARQLIRALRQAAGVQAIVLLDQLM